MLKTPQWSKKYSNDISKCLLQAYDTYTSLLREDLSLSKESINTHDSDLNQALFENESNIDFLEIAHFSSSNIYKVHNQSIESFKDLKLYGVVVIVEDLLGNELVLDGNHRVNTCLLHQIDVQIPTIKVKGYIPQQCLL